MLTSARIAWIKKVQVKAFSVLALLNINGHLFPEDGRVCDGDKYDFIVVGGGSAGAVVAARLVEANYKTLLIEAGGNSGLESNFPGLVTFLKKSRVDWNYKAEVSGFLGKCHQASSTLLGKGLGGSGITNFMIYGRGNARDYEKFYKATNDSSWKWNSMLKYFKKSEKLQDASILKSAYRKYHSSTGVIGVTKENRLVTDDYLKGFEEAGESVVVDNAGTGTVGYSSALYHILDGIRSESANSYLPPHKYNPNLHITRNSLATKIIFDKNKRAVGVEFIKNGTTFTAKSRKEVIITAGPIKSPQILMLSGIGPKEELEKMNINVISNLPVGKDLQNVPGAILGFRTNRKANCEPPNAHETPAPLIVGNAAINKSSQFPDYETLNFIIDNHKYFLSLCGFTLALKNNICDRMNMLADKNQIMLTVVNNINPKSLGEVGLKSTDPNDQPKIITGFYDHDDDLEAIAEYIADFMKIESTPHFQELGLEFMQVIDKCKQFEFGSREYWRCYALCMIISTGRYCGTCSLGSVVDSKLRVKGIKGLRVVDASVIPKALGSSIFASVVAVAEKGAEMIIENHRELK